MDWKAGLEAAVGTIIFYVVVGALAAVAITLAVNIIY